MTRSLVLCADDFGLTDGINRAILELIDLGRLSATSCMTTMPAWTENAAAALVERHDRAALGLHFNLTEGDNAIPLGKLMQQSLLGQLDTDRVQQAFNQQLDRFEALAELPPDFVDGHQHIQMFPVFAILCCRRCSSVINGNAPGSGYQTRRLAVMMPVSRRWCCD